jgi:hypothetical protein
MEIALEGYKTGSRKSQGVLTRLTDVRARGRKRVMVG